MTEFRADCTINIHVESRGHPPKQAWSCSLVHAKRGRVLLARGFLGRVSREEAELTAVGFALEQALRLQQEKVEVTATFPLEGILEEGKNAGRSRSPGLKSKRSEVVEAWTRIRLRRLAKAPAAEAELLREEAGKAYERKRN